MRLFLCKNQKQAFLFRVWRKERRQHRGNLAWQQYRKISHSRVCCFLLEGASSAGAIMFRPFQNDDTQRTSAQPQSWYPSSGVGPPSISPYPPLPNSSSSPSVHPLPGASTTGRAIEDSRPQTPFLNQSFSAAVLKEKSAEELRKLLSDKVAYTKFLHSLEEVKHLDTLRMDLRKSNVHLASHNLGKEGEIAELRNQCTIIRSTELAAAREKLEEIQKKEREVMACFSPATLLDKLQVAAKEVDDESEKLHQKLLAQELELNEFIHEYKKKRAIYHKRMLTHLAAATSLPSVG